MLPLSRPTPVRNVTCYGGCYYTVEENDTCDSISYDQGVSYDHFIYQNGLDRNCKTLSAGREVCVGSPCALYVVRTGWATYLILLPDEEKAAKFLVFSTISGPRK